MIKKDWQHPLFHPISYKSHSRQRAGLWPLEPLPCGLFRTLPPAGGPVGVTHNVRQTNLVSTGFANLLGTEQLKNSLVRFTHKAGGFLQRSRIRSSCI